MKFRGIFRKTKNMLFITIFCDLEKREKKKIYESNRYKRENARRAGRSINKSNSARL